MENSELFEDLRTKLNKFYDSEIVRVHFLNGTSDFIEFELKFDDFLGHSQRGLYSIEQNKAIFEPRNCWNFEFHSNFDMFSVMTNGGRVNWFDKSGKLILTNKQVHEAELLEEVENKLKNLYDTEIESIYFLKGREDIIVYSFESDGESLCGFYSINLNKVIFEPEICSDEKYHEDLGLISVIRYPNKIIWIDWSGKIILEDGIILKVFSNGFYLMDKEEESFWKDRIDTYRGIYKPDLESKEDEDYQSCIVSMVVDATEDEGGRFLMVESKDSFEVHYLGVYDMNNLNWVCEKQNVNK